MNDNKIRQFIPIIADSNGWIWINNSHSTSQHCQLPNIMTCSSPFLVPFFGHQFWPRNSLSLGSKRLENPPSGCFVQTSPAWASGASCQADAARSENGWEKNIKKNRRLPLKMPIIEWEKWYTINFWGIFKQSQESMWKTLGLDGDSRPNKGWSTEQMTQRRGTDAMQDM